MFSLYLNTCGSLTWSQLVAVYDNQDSACWFFYPCTLSLNLLQHQQ